MNNRILLLFIGIIYTTVLSAGNFQEHKWGEIPERVEIPEEFKSEEAVIIESSLRFTINYHLTAYTTKYTRIRILSKDGIQSATRILIPKYPDSKITVLDARTIKANGNVVNLRSEDIKEIDVNFSEVDVSDNQKFYLFSVPGVEVGDEVEMIYVIEDSPYAYNVYLHEEYPVLNATYTLTLPSVVVHRLYSANRMPQPEIERTPGNTLICTWRMQNLKGTAKQDYAINALELPHVIQVIRGIRYWFDVIGEPENITWPEYFSNIEKIIENEDKYISKKYNKSIESLLAILWRDIDPRNEKERIKAVHDYINKNMEIVEMDKKESVKHLGYFLEQKRITSYRLLTLYVQIFKKANIPYNIVFGRNKYNGIINPSIVTMNQVDHLFFAFNDENNIKHYLFPKDEMRSYELNELPPELNGTTAIFISSKRKLVAFSELLPSIDVKDISRNRKIHCKVDLENNSAEYEVVESFSGSYSSFLRPRYLNAAREGKLEEYFKNTLYSRNEKFKPHTIAIDTFSSQYPYLFKLKYNMSMDQLLSKIDDELYSLSFENWVWHNHDELDLQKRWMNYYPLFPHVDIFQYYITFDKDVEIVNDENININLVHSNLGAYILSVKQVNPKVLLLESRYILTGGEIANSKVPLLKEIYDTMEKGDNEPLVLRVKKQ